MLSSKIEELLNAQIEKECYSSQLYLAMASWTENQGFSGVSQWLYAQSDEERDHMMRLIHYVNDRGGKAIVAAIKKPPVDYPGIHQLFDDVMNHEQFITSSINDIVEACVKERDFTTHNWLQWFVSEQIEEEASVQAILDKLKLVGDHHLYMFDRDILGMRSKETGDDTTE